ncbi:GTP 3',8-cyclase MoaA [Chitinimonas koreensis]|uniref:GTP 3',8-cyclase MoaA n=1 Tax=Chitinimonas koreensis TaxID=356302 RepID=UPI0003F62713|nr:GTP 3',8-cyclase MoaA [Chitinimonas koreensis]QNM94808.1 GTP 3',8-cyclase MoaA [Chitinimonas koreensis]
MPLQDRYGRTLRYLRLSVTDRCDLRCSYCMPKGFSGFEEPADWLTFDEIERLVGAFARLGVGRVRLTGGEPLLRRDLPVLAGRLAALSGVDDLSLSTNATQLDRHAAALRAAGVRRLNISLDTLRAERHAAIAGRDSHARVLAGIAAAEAAGFDPIKINMVVQGGVNDDEVEDMAAFCLDRGFILRLIETMPVGATGRASGQLELGPLRERLARRFDLVPAALELGGGPARYWQRRDGSGCVGFITPISQHFCASCNRVRLAVDGTLYLCLGQEEKFEFRPLLRGGADDAELEAAIRRAIELKPERHEFRERPDKIVRFMSQTGG